MIGQRPAWEGLHFQELVNHFELFNSTERARLARLYKASSQESRALAMSLCMHAERLDELLELHALSPEAHDLLLSIRLEHGVQVQVNGAGGNLHILMELRDLGLLVWQEQSSMMEPVPVVFPGVLAAALAHLELPSRPSFFLLSGLLSNEEVEKLAKTHGIASGPRLVMIMELAQYFASEDFMASFLPRLDDPDQIGPAITALELGGMCYWQDVFGFDEDAPETRTGEAKVLPLVRDGVLRSQQDMAALLQSFGIIFKFDLPDLDFPMLAVPEELWLNLWVLARDWIMGWFEHTYKELCDTAITQHNLDETWAAHSPKLFRRRMLWITASVHSSGLLIQDDDEALIEHLSAQSNLSQKTCLFLLEHAQALGLLDVDDEGALHVTPDAGKHFDVPPRDLSRQLLMTWCIGRAGFELDRHVGQAVGVDETWCDQAEGVLMDVLIEQGELDMFPVWLHSEGVAHDMTGMGYLRDLEEQLDELLLAEFSVANSIINYTRMLWLDVVSTLDESKWYSVSKLGELMQFVLALSLFHHLAHLFEHPELSQYLPVQRPDYLTLPVHTDALIEWSDVLVHGLLMESGLAYVEDGRARFRARDLRIEGPPEMAVEFRERFMQMLLGVEDFTIENRSAPAPFGLRVLSAVREPLDLSDDEIELESWAAIAERLETHRVVGYDEAKGTLELERR